MYTKLGLLLVDLIRVARHPIKLLDFTAIVGLYMETLRVSRFQELHETTHTGF